MPSEIIEELDRETFQELLDVNPKFVIIKFTAEWCKPCQSIKDGVNKIFGQLPEDVVVAELDTDENFDLYAFMKSKKVVTGIPVMLGYKKGNTNRLAPDCSISGSDVGQINAFFVECAKLYN